MYKNDNWKENRANFFESTNKRAKYRNFLKDIFEKILF